MSKLIKIGPIHSVFESPFLIEIGEENGIISEVKIKLGYSHRGIEGLALQKTYLQTLELIERVCGLCSHTHALCFCQAVERLASLKVPPRAKFIRTIVAELERLHSHLFWANMVAEVLDFAPFASQILRVRERIMVLLEEISGNRVMFSINTIGGVRKDIENGDKILNLLKGLREEIEALHETFDCNVEILNKTRGLGVLRKEEASNLGVVGPTARASGILRDVRQENPYDAYPKLQFKEFVKTEGDAFSRIMIHFEEIFESINLIEQAVINLPSSPLKIPGSPTIPIGEAIGRVEAPRGELFYFVASDGGACPHRVKIRVPTFANLPALKNMLLGEKKENLNLILGSIDPCFSCLER